jgi:hypothetical protein
MRINKAWNYCSAGAVDYFIDSFRGSIGYSRDLPILEYKGFALALAEKTFPKFSGVSDQRCDVGECNRTHRPVTPFIIGT